MLSLYRATTSFKLFWCLVALFGSLNVLLVTAADPNEPDFWMGGTMGSAIGQEIVHGMAYNLTWGGRMNATNISLFLSQLSAPDTNGTHVLQRYPLAENATNNPYTWNVTLPVGTTWALDVFPNGGHDGIISMGYPMLKVVSSSTSSANKPFIKIATILGFTLLSLLAMMHL